MASTLPPGCAYPPISPPPPGKTCNFVHPESRASEIYVAIGICIPLIVVFAGLRFFAKLTSMKRRSWDDITCILGLLAGLSFIAITTAAVRGSAYAKHQWDITLADFTKEQLLLSLVVESVYGPFIWFVKLSLFVLYLEVFSPLRWLRHLAYTGIAVTGLFYFSTMIVFIVMCGPKHGQSQISYISALGGSQCRQTRPLVIILGVVNIISDLYLILLPLPAVWSLQLPLSRKVGVSAMFLTGFIACAASVFGLAYRIEINRSIDNTWVVIPAWITSFVEMTAGIMVCCMPATATVFKHYKKPITSFLSTYRTGFYRFSSSTGTDGRKSFTSPSDRQPIIAGNNYQTSNEVSGKVRHVPSKPQNDSTEWEILNDSAPAFPLQETKFSKTTEFDVTRKTPKELARNRG